MSDKSEFLIPNHDLLIIYIYIYIYIYIDAYTQVS
jgi:hypothetical protein